MLNLQATTKPSIEGFLGNEKFNLLNNIALVTTYDIQIFCVWVTM